MDEQSLVLLRRIDLLARSGATFVVKIDGQREAAGNPRRYTVLVSGDVLGPEGGFRKDGEALNELLAEAIEHYVVRAR
jgi:hypothetical protein